MYRSVLYIVEGDSYRVCWLHKKSSKDLAEWIVWCRLSHRGPENERVAVGPMLGMILDLALDILHICYIEDMNVIVWWYTELKSITQIWLKSIKSQTSKRIWGSMLYLKAKQMQAMQGDFAGKRIDGCVQIKLNTSAKRQHQACTWLNHIGKRKCWCCWPSYAISCVHVGPFVDQLCVFQFQHLPQFPSNTADSLI